MKTLFTLAGAAILLSGTSALAQVAGQDAAQAASSFTNAQIDSYATASIGVEEMLEDTALDAAAQQRRAGEILAQAGLDTTTFNAIRAAVASDPAVAERVQLALANLRGSPEA